MMIDNIVELGYQVFPIKPKLKTPLTPHGCKDGTNDLNQVAEWEGKFPDCNWGITCSNIFVIDVDGDEGKASFERLTTELGDLPASPRVETGKGFHLYFRRPEGELKAKVDKSLHIDIRTGYTYVVAPGSVHPSGAVYTESVPLCPVEDLPDLPASWLNRLQTKPAPSPAKRKTAQVTPIHPADDGDYSDAAAYISMLEPSVQGQGGSNMMMRVCNLLFWEWDFDPRDPKARAILDDYNARADPPWNEREIEHKIDSVFSSPPNAVRGNRRRAARLDAAKDFSLDFTVNGVAAKPQTETRNELRTEPVDEDPHGLALIRGDEIEMTPETWLWEDRIPLGHFSNVFGNGGIGKSAIVFDWAARVSAGIPWVDGTPNQVGSVLYFSMEQDEVDARAKIELWGGNIRNFHIVRGVWKKKRKIEIFDLSQLADLCDTLQQFKENPDIPDVRLIVIDPIISALGRVKDSSQSEIRNMLEPVRPVLKEFEVACIYICHSRKPIVNLKESSKDRCAGSQAFTSVARVNYEVIEETEDVEGLRSFEVPRIMLCAKRNAAVLPKGIFFRFSEPVPRPELMNRKLSMIEYIDHSVDMMMDTYTASKVSAPKQKKRKNTSDPSVEQWLLEQLSDGPKEIGHAKRHRTPQSLCVSGESRGYHYWKIRNAKMSLHERGISIQQIPVNGRPGWGIMNETETIEITPRELDEQDMMENID